MDLFDAMRTFARVVEAGSFTKGAETRHMGKAGATNLVQQLEAQLRVRLLNRTTRKVNVTADGAADDERVVRVLAEVDDAETSLSSGAAGAAAGDWQLGVYAPPASLARGELVPLFAGWSLDPMPLHVAFPPNRHVSARLRAFIEWVARLMQEHAPIGAPRGAAKG